MPYRKYRSAADFRRALEDRLQDIAKREAVDLQRVRREVAFDIRTTMSIYGDVVTDEMALANTKVAELALKRIN